MMTTGDFSYSSSNASDLIYTYSSGTTTNIYPMSTSGGIYNTTWTTSGAIPVDLKVKLCRNCEHCHIEGQNICLQILCGTAFGVIECVCKEYVPKDNLEYLEWKYNKKKLNEK